MGFGWRLYPSYDLKFPFPLPYKPLRNALPFKLNPFNRGTPATVGLSNGLILLASGDRILQPGKRMMD
jgi:hypothetical protein